MRNKRRTALVAAGLLAGAAALTGCAAGAAPMNTPTPKAGQQVTAQPATAQPAAEAQEETPAPMALTVDEKTLDAEAVKEQGTLLLPLEATAEALGWKADSQRTEEETQTRRVITLDREGSRITVSWTVSDNTTRGVTWQKDGLLIPVDARITTMGDVVYVPAAFFEEAMDVTVSETKTGVSVALPRPMETPQIREDSSGENG